MLKDEVLYTLYKRRGEIVTGGQLAGVFGVSRNAVWKAIRALVNEGCEIVSIPNSGYRLCETNDTLLERAIRDDLETTFIGREMTVLHSVSSTNQVLREMDDAKLPSGYAVIADEQLSGRGRRGRAFVSQKGAGVYVSVLLKLCRAQNDIRLITICAAVAVSKAIEAVCGIRADIKWVNDVYINGKKICGILTEAVLSAELQEMTSVIVGIGINTGAVPSEISDIATSVERETGLRGIRNRLIAEVFSQFEAVYLDYTQGDKRKSIISYYESRLFITGRRVFVSGSNHEYPAAVLGVDQTGALIVRDDGGEVRHISSGEIKLNWSDFTHEN